jgi:hypothetical protein
MAIRTTVCFVPGKAVSADDARFFGNEIAEPPILLDYLSLTFGSLLGDKERDWWDEGPLAGRIDRYLSILDLRHSLSAARRSALRGTPIPDILTYQGLNRDQLLLAATMRKTSRLVGVTALLPITPKKGTRNEYYEIKPANNQGQEDGRDKIDAFRRLYPANGLPYAAGTTYPDLFYERSIAHIPLLMRSADQINQWRSAVRVSMARGQIWRIDIYLEVSRRGRPGAGRMPDGLLLYRLCVAIETEHVRQDSLAIDYAREIAHAWIVCATAASPEDVRTTVRRAFLAFEPETLTRGDGSEVELHATPRLYTPRFPLIELAFTEIWPTLRPTRDTMREALISRGVGLPGEEYLVCCDDACWKMFEADALPALSLVTVLSRAPFRWYGYVQQRGSLGVMEMIVEVNSLLAQARAFGVDAFNDLVTWGNENPGKRTVLVLVVLVVAAATIYIAAPVVAAELGFGAVAAETAVETAVTTGLRVAVTETRPGQVVRVAMRQEIMEEALLEEAAQSVLQRQAVRETVRTVVRANAVPRAAAVNAVRQSLMGQASTPLGRQATAEFLKRAGPSVMAGLGITIVATGRVAYAAEPGSAPGAEAKGNAIGVQVGRAFLLKADIKAPPPPAGLAGLSTPQPIPPQLGQTFDAARFSQEAAATLAPGGPTQVKCHYLGRVKLS